jgi:hypothetical protein
MQSCSELEREVRRKTQRAMRKKFGRNNFSQDDYELQVAANMWAVAESTLATFEANGGTYTDN